MKKIILSLFLLTSSVFAQEEPVVDQSSFSVDPASSVFAEDLIIPNFDVALQIPVGQGVIFDGSSTRQASPSLGVPTYSWDFGDGERPKWGEKVEYSFAEPGLYSVTLGVKQGVEREKITKFITVYDKTAVLFTDESDRYTQIVGQAAKEGIWLKQIVYDTSKADFSAQDSFVQSLQSQLEFIQNVDMLIFYSKSTSAFQGFSQFWQKTDKEQLFDPTEKIWVQIYDHSLEKGIGVLRPAFNIIKPEQIVLTRKEAFAPLFETREMIDLPAILTTRGIEHLIVDKNSISPFPLFFVSRLTNYFIANGIPINVIYLLFAVPFITFVIAFARQFVGIATLGVYAPLMLTLSFMVLGLGFGFVVFISVLAVSSLIRMVFEKVDLLYIPRVALLLSVLSLSFFLILGVAVHFQVSSSFSLSIFPMLVMSTLSEKFLSAQSEGGMRSAVIAMTETVIVSILAYALVQSEWIHTTIVAFPELLFIPMVGIIWLGRFTGLRISEYFKFRALFDDDTAEEE